MNKLIIGFILIGFSTSFAQKRYSPSDIPKMPRMEKSSGLGLRYDVSGSSGTYNGESYSEINLGLNYQISNWWLWRNALFQRFGSNIQTVTGLDSSVRFGSRIDSQSGAGIDFFIGPGVRLASQSANAYFAEAGIGFRLGGLYLGVGYKYLQYFSPGNVSGITLPKNDSQLFFAVGGGGNL